MLLLRSRARRRNMFITMTMYLFLGLDVFVVDSMSVTAQKIFEVMDSGSDKILYLFGKRTIYTGFSIALSAFLALMLFKVVCQKLFYESNNSTIVVPTIPTIVQTDEQRHEQQPQEPTITTTKRECF